MSYFVLLTASHAKVGNLGGQSRLASVPSHDNDVARFHIPVDNSLGMHVAQSARDLNQETARKRGMGSRAGHGSTYIYTVCTSDGVVET